MYRYILEKYSGRASRHTCPRCGGRHEFTRYVDTMTGEPLSPLVGKCNHESSCGYHYTPKQYFTDNPVAAQVVVATNTQARRPKGVAPASNQSSISAVHAIPKPIGTIDCRYLDRSWGVKSHFVDWLSRYFDAKTVRRVVDDYAIGYTKDRRVIFWQQDIAGRVRTGQVMRYDPRTGRRVKGGVGAMNWVHAILKRRGELPYDFNLRQCLFGEHLLACNADTTVVLVESAKSAVVGAALVPEFVWGTTDGKAGFSTERCRALAGRKVIVIPDMDAHAEWSVKAPAIAREVDCDIAVCDFLVRLCTAGYRDTGYDIADYIIEQLDDGIPPECLADKLFDHLVAYFIPDRLREIIDRCLKEPFKK